MGDVISFPAKDDREWLIVEKEISAALNHLGMIAAAKKHVLEATRAFWELTNKSIEVDIGPIEIPCHLSQSQVDAVNRDMARAVRDTFTNVFGDFKKKLFLERTNREIDIANMLGL